ncbi:MAG: helix-turn-helix domain-containing protein [Thermodesulfovibrionales bacterium]|nr:helix-turn-helix domain-containing protein [Thermodesulfovibrionales bacterium]
MESRIIKVNDDINVHLGSFIKELRESKGISQFYLGIALGFSEETAQQQIYKYEKGLIRIPIDIAVSIAKILNVDMIFNGDNIIFMPR